jgi:formate hydrogenlyase subunit 3/multisubunit Na+/H+ antiporter MnhD subunit
MNLVMLGLFSFTQQGIEGAIFFMIAHGVVSTGLFFCVGNLYDRHHTRLLHYYGGLVTVMPLFSSAFFALTLANMSFPGTANFIGELLMLAGIHSMNSHVLLLASPSIVLSAAYSTFTYNRVSFGTLKTTYIRQFNDLTRADVVTVLSLVFAMLGLGLAASFILDFAHVAVKNILLFPLPPSISTLATPDAIVVSSEGISGTAINFPSWEELRQYFTYLITAFVLVQFINCPKCLFFIVEHRKLLGAIIIFFVFALLVKKSLQVGAKRT